jgi:hypothetical protein
MEPCRWKPPTTIHSVGRKRKLRTDKCLTTREKGDAASRGQSLESGPPRGARRHVTCFYYPAGFSLTNSKMMRIHAAALFLALLTSVQAGVDFTPGSGERTLEGIVFKQILFHQDGHTITYEQPRG